MKKIEDYPKDMQEFFTEVTSWASTERPRTWRYGQAVFNYVETAYGVSRKVQYRDRIDCFYDDNQVGPFIQSAWKWIEEAKKS